MEENIIKGKQFVIIAQEDSTDSDGVPIVLGCVILNLSQIPNAGHRGEVGKMIVGKEHRKRFVFELETFFNDSDMCAFLQGYRENTYGLYGGSVSEE